MKVPKIGVLMYTYNRTDDAKINMEIIRNVWNKSEILKDVVIVHSYNGEEEWWTEKYLENELLRLENPGHFEGAEILINEGVKSFEEKHSDVDYVIILASDTWLVKPEYIEKIILDMKTKEKYLATCVWGTKKVNSVWDKGVALDFIIFDLNWAKKSQLFPIKFRDFKAKYEELFFYNNETIYPEKVFVLRFVEAIARTISIPSDNILRNIAISYIYWLTDREPVHINSRENFIFKKNSYTRIMYWKKMGLITHHDPAPKRNVLKKWDIVLGEFGKKLLSAKDLSYYNRGLTQHTYIKEGEKIKYGD